MKRNYMNRQMPPPFVHQQNIGAWLPAGDHQHMCGPPPPMVMSPPPLHASPRWSVHTPTSHQGHQNCPSRPRMNHNYLDHRMPPFPHKHNVRGVRPTRGHPQSTVDQQRMCVPPPSYAGPPPPLLAQDHQNSCKAPDISVPPPPLNLLNNGFPENMSLHNSPSDPRMMQSYQNYGRPPFPNQRNPSGMPPRFHAGGDQCRFHGPRPLLPRPPPPQWVGHGPSTEPQNLIKNEQNQQSNRHQRFGRPNPGQKFARKDSFKQPAKKKRKRTNTSKRDKPENNAYFCDICDRGFAEEELYKTHCENHVQCDVDGCVYTAAAKLVKLHQECQHKTGLVKEIWKLESPEAIEKWILSRKKNYPSAENIANKKTNLQTRQKRGDVLGTKRFDYRNRRGGRNSRGARRGNVGHVKDFLTETRISDSVSNSSPAINAIKVEMIVEGSPSSESQCMDQDVQLQLGNEIAVKSEIKEEQSGCVASSHAGSEPLSLVLMGKENRSDSESSQSPVMSVEKQELVVNTSSSTGNLGSLMASYGDSDNSDEGPVEFFTVKDVISRDSCSVANNSPSKNKQLSTAASSHIAIPPLFPPGELPHNVTSELQSNAGRHGLQTNKQICVEGNTAGGKRLHERNNRHNGQSKWKRNGNKVFRGRTTLLEKLLAPDIRHERNVILQCVRYIVKHNFFDKKT